MLLANHSAQVSRIINVIILKRDSSSHAHKNISAADRPAEFQKNDNYCKIPKMSPVAYIFQRLFLRSLFWEGLIFGGACLRREICVSKALQLEVNLPFLLCFTLYLRAISKYKPPGGLYLEGRFNRGFFALPVWGAYIWKGLYMEELMFGILRVCRGKARFHAMQLHPPPTLAHAAKSVARALF